MTILELNHVALYVADLAASIRFYGEVLGLPQKPRPDFDFPGAWFALGPNGQELHLIAGRNEETGPAGSRKNHFALRVQSVKEVEQRLKAFHIPNWLPPRQRPDGAWQLFVPDPDGYFVELCQLQD